MVGFRDVIDPRRRLVDADGNRTKQAELTERKLEPRVGAVRPVISGHPAEGLTPNRLSRIHRDAAQGEPLAYLELAEDIEERDLHYLGVLSTRKRSVAQLPITVEAASDDAEHKKHAALVQSWVDDDVLRAALFDALDAVGKGFSVLEVDWRMHMGHLCPRELIYRPARWFMFDPQDGETVILRDAGDEKNLLPAKFLIHRHKSKSGLTIRSGIARVASWAWMYKSFTLKDWAIFVQNFGMPIRIGKYGPDASDEQKDVLWRAVSQIAGDCAAIVPADMSIELEEVTAKAASTDLYERRADWMDRQVSKAVLGQTTTTDAVSGGHAVAQEHRLVQEDIERSDAIALTASINRQLIPNLVAFNFGPQDYYPRVRIGRPDEVPLGTFAEAFDKLARHGLTAEASYLRERLGIPAPAAGATELVGGRAAAPAAPGGDGAKLLQSRHQRGAGDDLVDDLRRRLEEDAAGAMAGLTGEIRAALEQATDLRDAADRLAAMQLDPGELAEAMARGMALAHLAGQAALVDDLETRRGTAREGR